MSRLRTALKSGIKGSSLPIVIGESQRSSSLFYHSANSGHSNEHREVVGRPSGGDLYPSAGIGSVGHDPALDRKSERWILTVDGRSGVPHRFLYAGVGVFSSRVLLWARYDPLI
jgi:hypothetical protein